MTALKILSVFALLGVYCSSALASAYPAIVDARVVDPITFEFSPPEIIVPVGSYAVLTEIGDIDIDGIPDYQFQVFEEGFHESLFIDQPFSGVSCPSVYIAVSSVVGSSFVPSDAVEFVGLDWVSADLYQGYDCLTSYTFDIEIIPDLNNDGINELHLNGSYISNSSRSEVRLNAVIYGSLENGEVIDFSNGLNLEDGFELVQILLENQYGDVNGDGISDPAIININNGYQNDGSTQRIRIINGAALATLNKLSFDTLSGENVLIDFNTAEYIELLGGADYNGDSNSDIVITVYQSYQVSSTYVLYGADGLRATVNDFNSSVEVTQLSQCSDICSLDIAGDFNVDGFDDAVINNIDGKGSDIFIIFGSDVGLPVSLEPDTSTRVFLPEDNVLKFTFFSAMGDVNGDSVSDLLLSISSGFSFLLFGQAVAEIEDIVVEQLNGTNGFLYIHSDKVSLNAVTLADANNDGLDDIVGRRDGEVFLLGQPNSDIPEGVQGLSVATGQTMTFLNWRAPDAASNIDSVEIYVNGGLIDAVDANSTYYQFSEPAPDITAILTVQTVTSDNRVSTALNVPLSNTFQALRQLSATIYGENALELSWENEPNDYVVWRNGAVLAQINGNSYVDLDVQAGVEYSYHVTQGSDASGLYLGRATALLENGSYTNWVLGPYGYSYDFGECAQIGIIDNRAPIYRALYPASTDQLTVTTDISGVEFSTPAVEIVESCRQSSEFRTNWAGYQLYSSTALEIFWERATHVSGVVAYEISLFDEVLTTIDATSYFFDDLASEANYEYRVTAIAGDGSRSIPSVYSIYLPGNGQNEIEEPDQPPAYFSVSSDVYSSTAAELFWQLVYDSAGIPLSYRITRNGELLTTTDAQSYFDDSLQPGTTYIYEVVTISDAGLTGEAFVLEINTPSEGGNSNVGNAMPTGARGIVYSNSALEIFWDRSTDTAITGYVIFRNDEQINSTDGITFYDSDLAANSEYRYAIQATDVNGNFFGEQALVVLRTTQ